MHDSRPSLAMRLLLIAVLMVASLGFAPSAGAQAHHETAEHHSHAAHDEHSSGGQQDHGKEKTSAVVHVCPGCAFLSAPMLADAGPVPMALPRLPANPASLRSFNANPIPPPPRLS